MRVPSWGNQHTDLGEIIVNLKIVLAAGTLLFSSSVVAVEWGETLLTSGSAGFCFDITLKDIPSITTEIKFRMYTKIGVIIVQNNQLQVLADIQTSDESISNGPRVEPIGTPDRDRWEVGDLASFSASETASGTWRFKGRIANGTDPFLPEDNFGEFRVLHAGGSIAFTGHLITNGCNSIDPILDIIFKDGFEGDSN